MRGSQLLTTMLASLLVLAACSGKPGAEKAATPTSGFDLVIANGRVMDPESKLDAVRNVGITNGKVVAISEAALTGTRTIDAQGLVVAPGFIDLHSHAVMTLVGARMQALDGVTSAFDLENGVYPIASTYAFLEKEGRPINFGASVSWIFSRALASDGTPPEQFSFDKWDGVFARTDWQGKFAADKVKRVVELVDQGLREGGLGVGANLGYMPGANFEEFYDIAELTKKYDNAPTYVHVRHNEPYGPNMNWESHAEVIALAAMTGAHMHFCHVNSNATRHIPKMIAAIEHARKGGANITWEAYPYGGASTFISAAYMAPENLPNLGVKTTDIVFLETGERVKDEKRLAQLRKDSPSGFAVVYLLDENNPEQRALLDQAVTHPDSAIASDATYWQIGPKVIRDDVWPMPAEASSHPRSAGTFSRVVGDYVRSGKLTLMDALRKASLVPAQVLEESVPAMRDKGRIRAGSDADITIFDPAKIKDNATYEKPNQPSTGINYVIVNGTVIVENGKLDPTLKAGKPVRRPIT